MEGDDHDALVVEFMQVTACSSLEDSAQHLASCGWRLGQAVNLYFASVAGSSEAVRAPIPARSDTLYGASASLQPPAARPTGWESEHGNNIVAAADNHPRQSRSSRRRRRRDKGSTDDAAPPAAKKKKKTLEELYRPPVDLTYKGGFHEAKAHAAGTSRWLLVNVQATGEFASHEQNRDVWANDLVAQAVRDHFVLWQVDVHDRRGDDEGDKVSCYYKLDHDRMPVVLVVDPVTGQMVQKLRGATDPNDIIVMAESFAERKPVMPIRAKNKLLVSSSASPPVDVTASSSRPSESLSSEKKPARTATEKGCKLRVRFPDGQVVTKEFGAKRGVAALFEFCRLVASGKGQPFQLMRFTGGSMQQIPHENISFQDLGLHMSTVSMVIC